MPTTSETAREVVSERLNPALESLEHNVRDARKAMARGRRAAEDLVDDATLRVRRHPLRSVTLAVTAGATAGCMVGLGLGWLAGRRMSAGR